MKTIILTAFLLIWFLNTAFSQGWVQQNSGVSFNLNSVHFVDANTGYAVGDSGRVVIKTITGGTNWVRQQLPLATSVQMLSVHFLDANTGFVCGSYAPIASVFKTTNGGSNWVDISPTNSIYGLRSIKFINSTTGIAVGSAYSTAGWIFRTTNAGTNWTSISSFGNILHSIYFVDSLTGYACGEPGVILKTTNSGLNWVTQISNTTTALKSVYFINSLTGWAAGSNSQVYKTTSGGTNWNLFYNQGLCGLNSVYFANTQTGWVSGCEGAINGTKNGGINWSQQSFATTTYLNSLSFINSITGWAVGAGGRILKTTTGGLVTGVNQTSTIIPDKFLLSQNYPNPFNPVTKIDFDLPLAAETDLVIYNADGKEIAVLVRSSLSPGSYSVSWDGSLLSSGIFFYTLKAGDIMETKKMVLLK